MGGISATPSYKEQIVFNVCIRVEQCANDLSSYKNQEEREKNNVFGTSI